MRRPAFDMTVFKERRERLAASVPKGSAIILWAHPDFVRNDDVHHAYKPDTNLFYLSGWEEPESVLVIRPGMKPETVLFTRPKDATRETWDGFRYGPDGAKTEFAMDEGALMSTFDQRLPELLKSCSRVYYRFGTLAENDTRMIELLHKTRASHGRTGAGLLPVYDSRTLIGELRVIKTDADVRYMREACEISARAHVRAMRTTKPGMNERQVMANILHSFFLEGAAREGYGAIVAAGDSATTLHYRFNDQPCRDGDLILIDAGAETANGYTGDITRTFPINGKFTAPQRRVYEAVLRVQKSLLAMAKPGTPFKALMDHCAEALTDEMLALGLLKGSRADALSSLAYKKYYPHGMGHFLGLDVHDSGFYTLNGEPRPLEVGMAFTIEPGLYIPAADTSAPAEFRGIGVRIEDNVVITPTGHEVMTSGVPKEIDEIEAIVGRDA